LLFESTWEILQVNGNSSSDRFGHSADISQAGSAERRLECHRIMLFFDPIEMLAIIKARTLSIFGNVLKI
jgi:hypothetical protein